MSKRLRQRFSDLEEQERTGFISYTMAFDPDKESSLEILNKLPESGVDIIEFGMPFSDPMADGPAIQLAGIRSLRAGAKMNEVIELVASFRETHSTTPVILMGYINPLLSYGLKQFVSDAKKAGVDGLLIVDLPPEEDNELFTLCQEADIALIKLVTPTTTPERLKIILEKASGFIYYVAITGVTGTQSATYESIEKSVKQIRTMSDLPIAVGFGIKTPEDVKAISEHADAVIVGSALVRLIESSFASPVESVISLAKTLAKGVE